MSVFCRTLHLLPYFMCANSNGETAWMRRLTWAFAGRLCDKYQNLAQFSTWQTTSKDPDKTGHPLPESTFWPRSTLFPQTFLSISVTFFSFFHSTTFLLTLCWVFYLDDHLPRHIWETLWGPVLCPRMICQSSAPSSQTYCQDKPLLHWKF